MARAGVAPLVRARAVGLAVGVDTGGEGQVGAPSATCRRASGAGSSAPGRLPTWPRWAAPAAVALAHVALKAPHVGRSSLWLDEAVSVHFSQLGAGRLLGAVQGDTNPPLYYAVLWAWTRVFGDGEAAVRWPSVLASALAGAVLYTLARRAGGRFAAWCASGLFLVSSANFQFARQARPYALATLFGCVALAAFLRAVERPAWPEMLRLAAANALALFTHYVFALSLAAQAVALVVPWRGRAAPRRFAAAHAPVGAALLAWLVPVLLRRGDERIMGWLPRPGVHEVLGLVGFYADRSVALFFLLAGAAVAAVAWGRWRGARPPAALAPAVAWSLGPVALAVVASRWVPCFHERYLLYVTPALALALPLALAPLGPRARLAAAAAAVAALGVRFAQLPAQPGFAWRAAAERARSAGADAVVLAPGFESRTFAYYFDRAAFRDAEHTGARLRADGVLPIGAASDAAAVPPPGARRIAVVEAVTGGPDLPRLVRERLEGAGFSELRRDALPGVAVTVLARERPPPPADGAQRLREAR